MKSRSFKGIIMKFSKLLITGLLVSMLSVGMAHAAGPEPNFVLNKELSDQKDQYAPLYAENITDGVKSRVALVYGSEVMVNGNSVTSQMRVLSQSNIPVVGVMFDVEGMEWAYEDEGQASIRFNNDPEQTFDIDVKKINGKIFVDTRSSDEYRGLVHQLNNVKKVEIELQAKNGMFYNLPFTFKDGLNLEYLAEPILQGK